MINAHGSINHQSEIGWCRLRNKVQPLNLLCTSNTRDDQGRFPDYPSDEEGGSAAIFNPEKFAALDDRGACADDASSAVGMTAEGGARRKESERDERDGEKGGADKKGGSSREAEEEDGDGNGFVLKSSVFVRQLRAGQKTFQGILSFRLMLILSFIVQFSSLDFLRIMIESSNSVLWLELMLSIEH